MSLFSYPKAILHGLLREPTITLTVILTLAVGIAAGTVVFGVFEATVLEALPYRQPDRLAMLWSADLAHGKDREHTSLPNFEDWRRRSESFADMAVMGRQAATLTDGEEPALIAGASVTPNLFQLLGVPPQLGRGFLPEDDEEGRAVVVLAHSIWRTRFGSDPDIVGRTLHLDGDPYSVVGVTPPGFELPQGVEYWVPLGQVFDAADRSLREIRLFQILGRLEDGATLERARNEMTAIAKQLEREYPEVNAGYGISVVPLPEEIVGETQTLSLLLFSAAGLLVLIACSNVIHLLLIRALSRDREVAIRVGVGAGRFRLMRRVCAEALCFAICGGGLGLLGALVALKVLASYGAAELPRLASVGIDLRVVLFTAGLSLLVAFLGSIGPLVRLLRHDVVAPLREGTRSSTGKRVRRLQQTLGSAEIALTLVLLVGTGLLVKSLVTALRVETGFSEQNLLTLKLSLPRAAYPDYADKAQFFPAVLDRLRALPEVSHAAASSGLLLDAPVLFPFRIQNRPTADGAEVSYVSSEAVTPDYFETLGIPLVEGRRLTDQDRSDAPWVTVINATMVRRFWPADDDPIGDRIAFWDPVYGSEPPEDALSWWTVVGVVGDTRRYGYRAEPEPEMFVPFDQSVRRGMRLALRTHGDAGSAVEAVRSAVWELDPGLPIEDVRTMEEILGDSISSHRLNVLLSTLFAAAGMALGLVGLYGVIAFTVAESRRELGIRAVLGARRADLAGLVARQAARILVPGLAVGLVGGWIAGNLLASQLYRVQPLDPAVLMGAVVLLLVFSVPAVSLPARRAISTDPRTVIEAE